MAKKKDVLISYNSLISNLREAIKGEKENFDFALKQRYYGDVTESCGIMEGLEQAINILVDLRFHIEQNPEVLKDKYLGKFGKQ